MAGINGVSYFCFTTVGCLWVICPGSELGVRVGERWGRRTSVSGSREAKFRNDVKTLTRSWIMSWMSSLLLTPFGKWRNATPNPFILKCSLCTWGASPYGWGYFLHSPPGSHGQCPLLSISKTLLQQLVPLFSVSSVSGPSYWLISFVSFSIFPFVWPLNSSDPEISPFTCFLTLPFVVCLRFTFTFKVLITISLAGHSHIISMVCYTNT